MIHKTKKTGLSQLQIITTIITEPSRGHCLRLFTFELKSTQNKNAYQHCVAPV